jgi:hypothetical protein
MHYLRTATVVLALATAWSMAHSQADGPFSLRQDFRSAAAIKDVIAHAAKIPLRKRYGEMTSEEKAVIRRFYTEMGPDDEPPFPEAGMERLIRTLHDAQSHLRVNGNLYLVADVDSKGDVQSVAAYGSPDPDMTKFAASVIVLEKFKPALCAGTPCAQKFPFSLRFELR